MPKKFLFLIIFAFLPTLIFGQLNDGYQLGSKTQIKGQRYGAYYDYSDPEAVNIKVNVWGFVRYPGKYNVPQYTSVAELISFAGGPLDDSDLEDLRIYRVENGKQQMIRFNYNDLMWEDQLESRIRKVPTLKPSDVLIVPGEPRLYFRDWFGISLSIISALSSLTILILTITK